MADHFLQYDQMVQRAFRGVVRDALASVAEHGLPGRHHFFIAFRTDHPDASLPDHLRARHPHEMTIVLQNQFWGLEVDDEAFAVTVCFDKVGERLRVPLAAVTRFVDPSVNFGIQLQATAPDGTLLGPPPQPAGEQGEAGREGEPGPAGEADGAGDKVIALDTFRKS
jgi:hypothetical protein